MGYLEEPEQGGAGGGGGGDPDMDEFVPFGCETHPCSPVMVPLVRFLASFRRLLTILWLLVGIGLTVGVFFLVYHREEMDRKNDLTAQCSSWAGLLSARFAESTNQARLFSDVVATFYLDKPSGTLDQTTFRAFGDKTQYARPLVRAVAFAPRVLESERRLFTIRNHFKCLIDVMTGKCRLQRPDYVPFLFLSSPSTADAHILGMDALSHPNMSGPILAALDRGTNGALSAPFRFRSLDIEHGLVSTFPVYNGAPPANASSPQLRAACVGFIVAFFNFSGLWEGEVGGNRHGSFARIYDVTNSTTPLLMYEPAGRQLAQGKSDSYQAVSRVNLGDAQRQHEMWCRYDTKRKVIVPAIIWAAAAVLVLILLTLIAREILKHMGRMERDFRRMERLKDQMKAAKVAAEAASQA
eukprot:jgi/Mesen1/8312/ME000455S07471